MRTALALIAAVVLVVACGAEGHDIVGTFTLTDDNIARSGSTCAGTGGYSDVRDGLGVTVKDNAGKIIATSQLASDNKASALGECQLTFVAQVPDSDFYSIEVGHRGELTYSRDELEKLNWVIGFTLGGNE